MKVNYILIYLLSFISICSFSQVTTSPNIPEANQGVTIYFNKSGTGLSNYSGTIYAHTGVTVNNITWENVKGAWGNNSTQPALTFVSGTTYSLTISPNLYAYYGVSTADAITQICIVFRSDTNAFQSIDYFINVGAFQATLNSPSVNSTSILSSGSSLNITATNTNGTANYNLFANGTSIFSSSGTSFSYTDSNITADRNYDLRIAQGGTTFSRKFTAMINPGTQNLAMSSGLEDGINYVSDPTKAILVLDAPGKDFVYLAGTFNNWQPNTSYAMKKDPSTGKFWYELSGLSVGQSYSYQYWVADASPSANSPTVVKTADPYSTLVLSPYDDPDIPASTYPNMPVYPLGQEREVTVLRTGQTNYNWQVPNFIKPKKEDLVVYEVLIRDFDVNRNFQDLINKIDYFKNLKINAIELMPVMEFEGNESWGYNTSFHMALDKFYGTSEKMKEFVDLCHQNGIAVILDLALNHAFGRNPMVRMWMKDPDGNGWGDPSSENPYFNEVAKHSYSVGSDFNHSLARTKYYTKRVIKQWIQEYKIDGFRWDLTKGFTQNCAAGDDGCTNAVQADRVAVLKDYADYSWSLDPNHYAIFEHLGSDLEEKQWADYRLNETPSKGIMMWGELTYPYTQLIEGFSTNADITRMGHLSRNFSEKRLLGYPESHDKERLMYSAMAYGNTQGTSPPFNNLNNSLARMGAIGATSLLIPGPKMIWHFAELGNEASIFSCNNGSVNTDFDSVTGDCKLDTKQQFQWTNDWLGIANRASIYNDWAKMIQLKINEPVFEGNYTISIDGSNIRQRIYVFNDALPSTQLKNVVILANFSVAAQNINPNFPYPGTWYNLMDNSSLDITNITSVISIPAGQYRIFGNKTATLNQDEFDTKEILALLPNPANDYFRLTVKTKKVEIFTISGQLIQSFKEIQDEDYSYSISEIPRGIYFVKITDSSNREQTLKLVKK
jgi:glycosidase